MFEDPFEKKALEIVEKALEIEDDEERNQYILEACQGDNKLKSRVEHLINLSQTSDEEFYSLISSHPGDPENEVRLQRALTEDLKSQGLSLAYVIGEGGSSFVYQCVSTESGLSKFLAVKILKSEFRNSHIRNRFLQEVKILRSLNHPYIVRFIRQGELSGGIPFCVMEYIRGSSLNEFDAFRNLPFNEKISFLARICEAVSYAHSKGVIHRDLKPGNIMVVKEGGEYFPKLIDFGIARHEESDGVRNGSSPMTGRFQLFGTPAYMSPEQAMGRHDQIDNRTDIFSCGIIFHELILRKHPFPDIKASRVPVENIKQHILNNPSNSIKPWSFSGRFIGGKGLSARNNLLIIRRIIDKCIQAEQENRYRNINEVEDDLKALENNEIPQNLEFDRAFLWSAFLNKHYKTVTATVLMACLIAYSVIQHLINVDKLAEKNMEISLSKDALVENLYNEEMISAFKAFNNSSYWASLDHLTKIDSILPGDGGRFWEYRYLRNQVERMVLEPIRVRDASLQIVSHIQGDLYHIQDWTHRESLVYDFKKNEIVRTRPAGEYYMGSYDPDATDFILCALWGENENPNRLRLEDVPVTSKDKPNKILWENFSMGWVRLGGFGPDPSQIFVIEETNPNSADGDPFEYYLRILDRDNGNEISRTRILDEFRPMRVKWHQLNPAYSPQHKLLAFVMHNDNTDETVLILYDILEKNVYDTKPLPDYVHSAGHGLMNLIYKFSPDQNMLAIFHDETLSIYEVEGKKITNMVMFDNSTFPVWLSWYDNTMVLCAYESGVKRVDFGNGLNGEVRSHDFIASFGAPIMGLLADRENSVIITSHNDGNILHRNVEDDYTSNPQHLILKVSSENSREILDWHFDEDTLAVSVIDANGKIEQYRQFQDDYELESVTKVNSNIKEASFSPDSRLVVFSDKDDDGLKIFDIATGETDKIDENVHGLPAVRFIESVDPGLAIVYTRGPEDYPTREVVRRNLQNGQTDSVTIPNGLYPQMKQISKDQYLIEHNTEINWDSLPFEYFTVDFSNQVTKKVNTFNLLKDYRASFCYNINRGIVAGGPAFNGIMDIESGVYKPLEEIDNNETNRAFAYEFFPDGDRLAAVSNRDLKARLTIHETANGEVLAEIPLGESAVQFARLKVSTERSIITCFNFSSYELHVIGAENLVE